MDIGQLLKGLLVYKGGPPFIWEQMSYVTN